MKKQQICFADQVDSFFHRQDYIKSLKTERLVLIRELATIGQTLLNINDKFNSCRVGFDNTLVNKLLRKDFGSIDLDSKNLEELAELAMSYKKLSKLFKKYHKQLVAIELEIITIKSNSLVSSNC